MEVKMDCKCAAYFGGNNCNISSAVQTDCEVSVSDDQRCNQFDKDEKCKVSTDDKKAEVKPETSTHTARSKASHLKRRKLVTRGKRNYQCIECDKTFTQRCTLNRHMLTHTGEKNYQCKECDKTFTQS